MNKINWIIISSQERGTQYGVGTFVKQLSAGLAQNDNLEVIILKIGGEGNHAVERIQEKGMTVLLIPLATKIEQTDTRKNQEKIARSIVRVVLQYIMPATINVVHMNYLFQYFIAKELKERLEGVILFTQHVFTFANSLNTNHFDTELETYKLANQVITVTYHGKKHLAKKGVDEDKIRVIYNGIDPKPFEQRYHENIKEKYGLPEDKHLVLYSGRIDHIKGLEYLALAFGNLLERIPNCHLVIAGNGDFETLIKATRHFSSQVSFLGFISFEELVSLYHISTIGVIPSLEEHCSYVALEMLFCGLPVVASGVGGLKEICIHNENALLVDMLTDNSNLFGNAPNIEQFAIFMYDLLMSKELREKFSKNAISRANTIFKQEVMVNNYLKLIDELSYYESQK